MDGWPINPFDTAVIVIILLSGGLAFLRGFTREILSLLAWLGAAAIAYFAFPHVRPMGAAFISPGWLADGASALGAFIPSLIVLWILSHAISQKVKGSRVGALDHTLGFIFGLGRGAALVAILFLGLGWLVPMQPTPPDWVAQARTLPLVSSAANLFLNLRSPSPGAVRERTALPTPVFQVHKRPADSPSETGYKTTQRTTLKHLIEGDYACQ